MAARMRLTVHDSIDDIPAAEWNALDSQGNPFVRHEFLAALEHNDCVGERFGWLPQHLTAHDDAGRLLGAAPLYLKDNSYGEFVFDWAWAEAYERAGMRYYPKLVSAMPYTPAPGPRLLTAAGAARPAVTGALIQGTLEHAERHGVSSLHWLFTTDEETGLLEQQGLMRRTGCQFHWFNEGFADFDDFLATFTSSKRKKLKRERRRAVEAGLEIEIVHGHQASDEQIAVAEMFYRTTFDKKWGFATLNLGFFQEVARTMGPQLVLVLARDAGRYVAGAICFRGEDALYGRHWGCVAEYHSLHFELCYYQGIDYCIREGLSRFEPGAQGEHKVGRGFRPTPTWSAHWIANPQFRNAIEDFVAREARGMDHYMQELSEHLPFRNPDARPLASGATDL